MSALHPEVPLLTLLRQVHLDFARIAFVLRRVRIAGELTLRCRFR